MTQTRCSWPGEDDLMIIYHDEEWGVPIHDDRKWFEKIILDGAQAGLSWKTILHKREGYRRAFEGFDPEKVARFDEGRLADLMLDPGIVRNRLKIASAVKNARAFLQIRQEFGSFNAWIWSFTGGKPVINRFNTLQEIPARTDLSDRISKELKKRGFTFVGSTIVYAFLQAGGVVNDHLGSCFRKQELEGSDF
ncbi:MAG: DNA-3-methyladenine glycosylase I [Bacteroidetes bacterium]|nr:DNA-3-methyladenine glycosylase I [Bacteroidota bacterium]